MKEEGVVYLEEELEEIWVTVATCPICGDRIGDEVGKAECSCGWKGEIRKKERE